MPTDSFQCKSCDHIFDATFSSLIDELKCPRCSAYGPAFGKIENRRFHLLDTSDDYRITLGMVEDVFEFYYSRSRYYRKDLADFVENRLKIHMKKHNETFLFVGDDGISYTMEEVYQLLLEDPATRREIYGMWMGMSR